MFQPIADLSKARILVSNDDGVRALGLKTLREVAKTLADDVWVVVPEVEQSGAGHSLSLRRPLRVREVENKVFAVDGTPTDSVLMAVNFLMKDRKPDLVLSGINRGANLGDDVTYSGTVAAAMEGILMGVPAIALSQVFDHPNPVLWETGKRWAPRVISQVISMPWDDNVLLNINFPNVIPDAVTGVVATAQGRRKLGDELMESHDPSGRPYYWIGPQRSRTGAVQRGSDLDAISRGAISITPLCVDFTHRPSLENLREMFQ